MKNRILLLASFLVLILSCNDQKNTGVERPLTDSLSEQALRIKNSTDSSKAELLHVQNETQHELDSLSGLLNNDEAMTSMSNIEFDNLKSKIGKKIIIMQKIATLQPLEQNFDTAYLEFSNTDTTVNSRKEKLIKLDSFAKVFKDSIKYTIHNIKLKK